MKDSAAQLGASLTLLAHFSLIGFADREGETRMCNLYNITIGPQAFLEFTRAVVNHAGNLEPGKVYPDYEAPIVRMNKDHKRELAKARWGMPYTVEVS